MRGNTPGKNIQYIGALLSKVGRCRQDKKRQKVTDVTAIAFDFKIDITAQFCSCQMKFFKVPYDEVLSWNMHKWSLFPGFYLLAVKLQRWPRVNLKDVPSAPRLNTSTSLFPCVTNKAELPPHSLVNRHRSRRAKGRRGGGASKQTRQKQDDVPGRITRVSVTPPVGPLMTAGGIPGVHPSERRRRTAGKNQTCQPGTKSSCLDKEQPPQIRRRFSHSWEPSGSPSAPTHHIRALWRFCSLASARLTAAASALR